MVLIPIIQNEGDGEENLLYLLMKEKRTLQGRSCYFEFTLQSVRGKTTRAESQSLPIIGFVCT